MSGRVDVADRMRALADAPWVARGDAATQAALREGAAEIDAQRLALTTMGARERATAAERDALRTALDGARAGDLRGLGAREAAAAHRWRGCHRCGRAFLLSDTEALPGHAVTVDGEARACGAKGEGR